MIKQIEEERPVGVIPDIDPFYKIEDGIRILADKLEVAPEMVHSKIEPFLRKNKPAGMVIVKKDSEFKKKMVKIVFASDRGYPLEEAILDFMS